MTTIVCDRYQMSSDSIASSDEGVVYISKIFRIRGGILGYAGSVPECTEFVNWFRSNKSKIKSKLEPDMSEVQALYLTKSGIYCYDFSTIPYKIKGKFTAIGTGSASALGAMHMGATTQQAVKISAKVNSGIGGPVVTKKLKD